MTYHVRNPRGVVVRTFGDATSAIQWAKAHSEALAGKDQYLSAYAVETIVRERLLTAEPEIVQARARVRRVV
jgi:hypothetical protein